MQKPGYARAAIEQRLHEVVAATALGARGWRVGLVLPVHAVPQRLVTEQLGRLIAGVSPAGCIDDLSAVCAPRC